MYIYYTTEFLAGTICGSLIFLIIFIVVLVKCIKKKQKLSQINIPLKPDSNENENIEKNNDIPDSIFEENYCEDEKNTTYHYNAFDTNIGSFNSNINTFNQI